MSDDPINIPKELEEANARLPINLSDQPMPLDMNIRSIALTLAQRHVGDTVVKEGGLYQQLKLDNKPLHAVSVEDVIRVALVFERYLWGEWSKGIAEHALEATLTEAGDVLEDEFKKRRDNNRPDDSPPTRRHSGGGDVS